MNNEEIKRLHKQQKELQDLKQTNLPNKHKSNLPFSIASMEMPQQTWFFT